MSATEDAPLDIREAAAAPPSVQDDGTVLLHLIRPCVGRGKGRHVYEADMLERNAHKFSGWKMFLDHESDAERKARGGLPRPVRELGGMVLESHWDPTVPAEGRFGAGAVVGKVRPIKQVGDLVAVHPSLVESSINARATGVRPVTREGGKAWLVEGIEDKGSVDWVTEGGAGGKIVQALREAADGSTPEEQEAALFESMTDDEVRDMIAAERPAVVESLVESAVQEAKKAAPKADPEDSGPGGDGGADEELENLIAKLQKRGLSPEMARQAAVRQLKNAKEAAAAEDAGKPSTDDEEGAVAQVSTEQIAEALKAPEVAETIKGLVEAQVTERLGRERTEMRAEAYADAERQIEIRDLRDTAHALIREAKLPEQFERKVLDTFTIVNGDPTDALDVFEAVDADGNETASAEAVLREAVTAEINEARALVASVRPTRVRGQGPTTAAGDGSGGEGGEQKVDRIGDLTRHMLAEAGINDPDKAFESATALRG